MNHPIVYALDFDGVICNSAVETAITGWKAARHFWNDMPETVPQPMIDRFREVRPLIETGYEAILAMRLLQQGETCAAIYRDYSHKSQQLLQQAQVDSDALKKCFGATRDAWIAADLDDWIAMNPLFPGVADKLRRLAERHDWYVVTTKQERFVKHILTANGIELAGERIFGLDRNLSKPEVLKKLLLAHPRQTLYFIEDRLPTLTTVRKHPELNDVRLGFALWGYNTDEDKTAAMQQIFACLTLADFLP